MCAMKTPRTIVEECLNSSRTHSSDIMLNRQRGRLVRTPDRQTRSTERKLKHDRVSSLRSKRSLSSTEEELTPRQLIEGFFEGNDSTVPLLRNRRRTSQSGVSASQPALPVTGRWSSPIATGNLTMDMMDKDTPRTLLQRVLHNATDIIETPQVIKGLPSPQVQTPEIPVVERTYHTPSPFKAASVDSGTTGSSSIRRLRTPRSITGKFNISAPDDRDNISSSSEGAFLSPTNYEEPSIFQDTSESDIFESQSVKNDSNQTTRNRGGFNITVPAHLVDELSRYQQSVQNDDDDDDGGDDNGGAGRHNTEEPMVIQETYREYELPLKSDNNDSFNGDSDQGSFGDADGQFRDESASRSILRGGDDSVQKSLRSELRRSSETRSEYTASRRSVSGRGEQSVKNSYNSVDDLENEVVMETSIQSPGEAEEVYETEDGSYVDSNGRHVDINREGRYSVGHTSRFESPINDRRSRMSEGHKRSNQGHIDDYFLPTQEHQQSLYKETERSHSNENLTYPGGSQQNLNTTNRNRTGSLSEGQDNEQMSRRHHLRHSSGVLETKNETYYQEKMAGSRTDHIDTLPNTTSSFSPTISSTQKLVTVIGDVIEDSPLQTVTPSPVVSPNVRSRTSGSVSRQNTSSDGSRRTPKSNSSNRSNRKRSIEVASTPQSTSSNRSTPISGRKAALLSQQNSTNVSVRRMSSQGSHTPRSEVMSSPQSLDVRRTSPRRSRTPQSRIRSNRKAEILPASGRSPTSPVVAGRINNQQGLVQGLPNNTAFFSPQVASTQNVATISRLSASRTTTGAREDNNEVDDDDAGQWEDDMEIEEVQSSRSTPVQTETVAAKEKKAPRKPRQKSNYSIPVTIVKKHFTHFAGMRVSKEAIEEVMKASEKYWDNLAADLDAYAKHAGRKTIQMADFVLLFKRQGLVTEKQSLNSLIEKYLPMEEREKLIHVARAGNRIEPKL